MSAFSIGKSVGVCWKFWNNLYEWPLNPLSTGFLVFHILFQPCSSSSNKGHEGAVGD